MRAVILESPYSGDVLANKEYLQKCILDCLRHGESPYASHQMLTDALNDLVPEERKLGIEAALPWLEASEYSVGYVDRGVSGGMLWGFEKAQEFLHTIWLRSLVVPREIMVHGGFFRERLDYRCPWSAMFDVPLIDGRPDYGFLSQKMKKSLQP